MSIVTLTEEVHVAATDVSAPWDFTLYQNRGDLILQRSSACGKNSAVTFV